MMFLRVPDKVFDTNLHFVPSPRAVTTIQDEKNGNVHTLLL
jgi:hypothetical protein